MEGNEMLIWGGYNGSTLNSGGRYNPTTDGWAATSTTSAPTSRYNHTAIWSGTEMIIWGGFNGSSELNSGRRYCGQSGPTPSPTPTATPTATPTPCTGSYSPTPRPR